MIKLVTMTTRKKFFIYILRSQVKNQSNSNLSWFFTKVVTGRIGVLVFDFVSGGEVVMVNISKLETYKGVDRCEVAYDLSSGQSYVANYHTLWVSQGRLLQTDVEYTCMRNLL